LNHPEPPETRELYAIADLAREFDISTRAIRFYESRGLISPERVGNTRVFRRRDRARLILILRGKRLGFSLKDIGEYLSLYDDRGHSAQIRRLFELIDRRMALLTQQMRDIETTISELSEVRRLAEARMNDDSGDHVAAE
jgi:DNA-binding transcriptional MerR regulator